ncbi:MAG: HAMP domain-containing histidine kinase [bacterium]|nr:HAMP domain-containing histidine kinase [bacterium]
MVFKSFKIITILRISLLFVSLYLLVYLILETQLYASMIIVGSAVVYQVFSLLNYIDKTNKDLTRFLLAIKHSDFSQTFTLKGLGSTFDSLKSAFSEVTEEFKRTRTEKEQHFRYLQTIVKHVNIGIIVYDLYGDIELINTPIKKLFKIGKILNIDEFNPISRELVETLYSIRSGDRKLVKTDYQGENYQLAVYASQFKLYEKQYTLVSIQNIRYELEEKEMEAWQNLIRVLTHEIMNSITPISSLASTANELVSGADPEKGSLEPETLKDIEVALETIYKRSQGLLQFVNAYRNLTKIPPPNFQIVQIKDLFNRIGNLLEPQLKEKGVRFEQIVEPPGLEVTADPDQVEQILINLIVNAEQALSEVSNPEISIEALINERSRIEIKVIDNGPGILEEVQDKIFIPFFTTKKGGSGIGLSLCRQIMRFHKGTIRVSSDKDSKTVFSLTF